MLSLSVRLADGSNNLEGRVEIFYPVEQEWGTVCDDLWGDSDARVVCSQLGYEGGMAMPEAHFGEGTGNIWLDSVECVGNEEYLSDCGHSEWGQHDCVHAEDAGVICGKFVNTLRMALCKRHFQMHFHEMFFLSEIHWILMATLNFDGRIDNKLALV